MVFFFFFFRLCSVDAFRHHRHVSAGGTVCEETENTGMPCESFFRFCFRRKKRTIRCCAAFLGLGKPSMPPTTSPGDNTHTKRKPASVFSSCRSSVQVLRFFFFIIFFFISSGLLFVVFIFIFYVRYLSWSSSSSLLITKHPRGFLFSKKSESDSLHQPHCHIKPPRFAASLGRTFKSELGSRALCIYATTRSRRARRGMLPRSVNRLRARLCEVPDERGLLRMDVAKQNDVDVQIYGGETGERRDFRNGKANGVYVVNWQPAARHFHFFSTKKKKKCCGSWETVLRNLGGDLSTLRHSPQAFCRLSLAWILEYSTTRKYI